MNIDINKSIEKLKKRKKAVGAYQELMDSYLAADISTDMEFQKKFDGFYKIRRNAEWRKCYFEYFERIKKMPVVTFPEILHYIYEETGRVEASFSSKMLATINPEMPIWDSIVLKRLGLKLKGTTSEQKLANAEVLYQEMVNWYLEFKKSQNAQEFIRKFDEAFPEYKDFSGTKKIDFILWGSPDTKERE